jgi:RinA family phage transcriptional activator
MSRKTHSFGHAEQIISNYEANKKKLAEMEQAARDDAYNGSGNPPEIGIQGKGKTSDPTAVKALLMFDPQIQHLTEAILAVKRALEDFEDDPRYNALHTIIDLYYWQGTHTIKGAAEMAGYTERQARRLKNKFVSRVAQYLGWM